MSWKEIGEGIWRMTKIVQDRIPETTQGTPDEEHLRVDFLILIGSSNPLRIIYLVTSPSNYISNSITYTTLLYAHLRLSHSTAGRRLLPFPISPRNSLAAVANIFLHALSQLPSPTGSSKGRTTALSSNLVYQNPTIRQLSITLSTYSHSDSASESNDGEGKRKQLMHGLVEMWVKFS
ncbi:hypothetical protein M422DRAFT_53839 [Sphaerobolus stellatus SS14]|uniref:Uncharacterized protein n=1 Tax=Sphaerobolus stellatus (strain SS14) TaxID=990650 RepID=A0A0C9TKE0_SPHS4|nr:hypothetical protein M422DRAFT_53839 [Sphaerobolus stellatus SS14]